MKTLGQRRTSFQHYLNALPACQRQSGRHVYCRLVDMGISSKLAKRMATLYERLIAFTPKVWRTSHLLYH